jgi:hypothetical protein
MAWSEERREAQYRDMAASLKFKLLGSYVD